MENPTAENCDKKYLNPKSVVVSDLNGKLTFQTKFIYLSFASSQCGTKLRLRATFPESFRSKSNIGQRKPEVMDSHYKELKLGKLLRKVREESKGRTQKLQ